MATVGCVQPIPMRRCCMVSDKSFGLQCALRGGWWQSTDYSGRTGDPRRHYGQHTDARLGTLGPFSLAALTAEHRRRGYQIWNHREHCRVRAGWLTRFTCPPQPTPVAILALSSAALKYFGVLFVRFLPSGFFRQSFRLFQQAERK